MFTLECNNRPYRLDDAGFLVDREEWNEELAAALASMVGIDTLSEMPAWKADNAFCLVWK